MALCTLLRQHINQEGWPEFAMAYTIDHRVRPESSQEAVTVGQWVSQLGIPSHDPVLILHRLPTSHHASWKRVH
jgi:hypothetical protein